MKIGQTDLFSLESSWGESQRNTIREVRRFVQQEVLPCIRVHQEAATFPQELVPGLAKLGILESLAMETLDPLSYGLAMKELESGGSGIRSFVSVQGSLVLSAIQLFGSDAQKETWVPALGRLEAVGCFALTEPDFGSNPSGMRTRAEKTKNGFRLQGAKMWITNGTLAKVAVVWAKLEEKIRGFLVETDRPGFEARPIKNKWSFRASDTAEIFLEGVEIPEMALLPGTKSLGSALKCLNQARYGIAWGVVGAARACLEETLNYLNQRIQFENKPLSSHQLIQNKLAWMATELVGMELIAKRLGELKASGEWRAHQVSAAKMNNCRKALDIARTCRDLLGAAGISYEFHTGRHLVDLETVVTYEGTEHIHALIVGQQLTGHPAYV